MATRRIGAETSATRALILAATERMMVADGYAAVSTRKVAAAAGLTPPLVHYYFPTTDDLFVAVYARNLEQVSARLDQTLSAPRPLHALWAHASDPELSALAVECLALANHRKGIRARIVAAVEEHRQRQAALLERLIPARVGQEGGPSAIAAALLMAAIGRLLVMEGSLGIALGHDEVRGLVEAWLDTVEPD